MMSLLSGAGNDGSAPEICTTCINDAQQLNLMEEGNGAQNNAYDAGAGAHANMEAAVSSIDPPMPDSQTIAAVTDIATQHDQMEKELKGISANVSLLEPPLPDTMIAAAVHQTFNEEEGDVFKMNLAGLRMTSGNSGEINSALMPPISDAETIAAVIDIDAQCDQMGDKIKGIKPPLPDNTTAATIEQRMHDGEDVQIPQARLETLDEEDQGPRPPPQFVGNERKKEGGMAPKKAAKGALETMNDSEGLPLSNLELDEEAGMDRKKAAKIPQARLETLDEEDQGPRPPPQFVGNEMKEKGGMAPTKAAKGAFETMNDSEGLPPSNLELDEDAGMARKKAAKGMDEEVNTDLAGLDVTSDNSGQVNLEGGEHVLDDEGSEIANTAVGLTTSRDQNQMQGPCKETQLSPSPLTPQAAGQVEDVSDGTTQGRSGPPRLLRAEGGRDVLREPSVPILEAMLVEDEIPKALVCRTSVYQATRIPDPLPVPWWKRHQKCLIGFSAAILVALSVALGAVISPDDADSNLTYYPDRINRMCSNTTSGRDNSPEQILFETAESCCEKMFWDYQDECLVNSLATSHHPSSPPSDIPTISNIPTSPPSESPSSSLAPSLSSDPTSSRAPSPIPSQRPTTQLQSSALRLVTSEDVLGSDHRTENVAVQGDTAVIGAPFNDKQRGAAFVLKKDESGWSQLAKLEAPDGKERDLFGHSVAIDGDTIVVGAYRDDFSKGSVHVFAKINNSWRHRARLVAPVRDADGGDLAFGFSVDIHRDRVVVGAVTEYGGGAAYVFVRDETMWAFESKLLSPSGDFENLFGRSVGIFDDTIIVGAPYEYGGAADSGAAHMYSRNSGGSWEHCTKLFSPDGAYLNRFGQSVAIHGNRVIVSAPWADSNGEDAGASFVFADDGSAWTLEAKLLAPDRAGGDLFGYSVSIFEGTALVSSPRDDDNGEDSGSTHVFELARGAWAHRAKVLAPDGAVDDLFGCSVAVHNGTVIAHSLGSGEIFAFSE